MANIILPKDKWKRWDSRFKRQQMYKETDKKKKEVLKQGAKPLARSELGQNQQSYSPYKGEGGGCERLLTFSCQPVDSFIYWFTKCSFDSDL